MGVIEPNILTWSMSCHFSVNQHEYKWQINDRPGSPTKLITTLFRRDYDNAKSNLMTDEYCVSGKTYRHLSEYFGQKYVARHCKLKRFRGRTHYKVYNMYNIKTSYRVACVNTD